MDVVDLFCGAGGFSFGFHQAGFRLRLAVDHWKLALDTHAANMPDCEVLEADILKLDPATLPKADVIIGSPPCQNLSSANKKRDPAKGMVLVNRYLDIVRELRPKYWVMEQVPPVLRHLRLPGDVKARVLNAADYGVPQVRNRAFVGKYPMPTPTHARAAANRFDGSPVAKWVTVRQALGIRRGAAMSDQYGPRSTAHSPDYYADRPARTLTHEPHKVVTKAYGTDVRRRMDDIDKPARTILMGGGPRSDGGGRPPSIPADDSLTPRQASRVGKGGRVDPVVVDLDKPANVVIAQGTSANLKPLVLEVDEIVAVAPDTNASAEGYRRPVDIAPTVIASGHAMGGLLGVDRAGQYRRLTVEETAILQGFPSDYAFLGSKTSRYKQVGNSVPPPVANAIAKAILEGGA